MYVFTHEPDRVIPGTNHTFGAAHAGEIVYKFNNVQPAGAGQSGQPANGRGTFADSRPESVQTARTISNGRSGNRSSGHMKTLCCATRLDPVKALRYE